MKLRGIATLVLALSVVAGSASAQSIGVFFDPAGGTCAATIGAPAPFSMYILASLSGPSAGGLTGVEFRLDNIPGGWFLTPTVNTVFNTVVGTSLGIGYNLASGGCQAGTGGVLTLFSISGFATSLVSNHVMSILKHTTPSNPAFQCPLQVLCDAPVFTKVCVNGGQGIINGGNCTVGVEQTSWSTLKSLYN